MLSKAWLIKNIREKNPAIADKMTCAAPGVYIYMKASNIKLKD